MKDRNGVSKYTYYRLCESYRIGDNVRHRNLLSLGKLDELSSEREFKMLADRIEALFLGQPLLFQDTTPDSVEVLAQKFYSQLRQKKIAQIISDSPDDMSLSEDDKTLIKLKTLAHLQVLETGAEWLCLQGLQQLGLPEFFKKQGWDEKQINTCLTHIISKAVFPASEHKTAQWIEDNSAIKELLFSSPVNITRYQLYSSGIKLFKEKEALEAYLSHKTNELFDIEDKIILYDLTNTYFEGRKEGSEKAKFGRSKEKRSDAKLLALALVCNQQGFVKHSKIYSGNISDSQTLTQIIQELTKSTSELNRKPMVILDAGIATEDNLKVLKGNGYDYLCVTRSKLKDYAIAENSLGKLEIFDKRNQRIEIQEVEKQGEEDKFLYVHSYAKAEKEASMRSYLSVHFEEELANMERSIQKKGGTKKIEKVYERLGRIKERYPSANKHYKIEVTSNGTQATAIKWKYVEPAPVETNGVYFLRTSKNSLQEKEIWDIYNTLTQIEATFRILKTDLNLRPVYHINDDHSDAHIFLGIVAYMLVASIRYQLKEKNINYDWQNIVRIMNTQKVVISTAKDSKDQSLLIKKCSNPIPKVMEIYNALNFKHIPFRMKKFVLPQLTG